MSKDGVREFRELLDSTKFQADILEDLNKISKTTFIKPRKENGYQVLVRYVSLGLLMNIMRRQFPGDIPEDLDEYTYTMVKSIGIEVDRELDEFREEGK